MYYIVKLRSQQKFLIPQNWIKNLDQYLMKIYNYGITYIKRDYFKVFISNNFNDEPDFQLPVLNAKTNDRSGCYEAQILRNFGKDYKIQLK